MRLQLTMTPEGKTFKIEAKSPLGDGSGFFTLDTSLTSKMDEIQKSIERQIPLDKPFVEELGAQLFDMLSSGTKDLFSACLNSDHLDIILDMKDPTLHALPWEICYDPHTGRFLGADPRCSLVRRDQEIPQSFPPIDYPLKVLLIVSSPMDLDEKGQYQPDPDEIMNLMEPVKKLEDTGMVQVDLLERASVARIQEALKEGYHIVHFTGHGHYNADEKKGYLLIEDKDRNSKTLEGRDVAALFGVAPPQLMIFSACESSPLVPFLLSPQIPAVLAMQYSVFVGVAHEFVERFYSLVMRGDSVMQAVSNARSAVRLEEGMEIAGWFTPVLYVRSENILKLNTESVPKIPEKKVVKRFDMDKDLIGAETFVGRRKDLWLIEKAFFEDNRHLVVVEGIGGIGKSSLASKFVRKHRQRFHSVFARKVVASTGVEEILVYLDQFLMGNGEERLHEVMGEPLEVKLEVLNHCLKKSYLLVLDNLEEIIKNSLIVDEGMERLLQTVVNGDHSSKVLITTRYPFAFRDGKGSGLMKRMDVDDLSLQYTRQFLAKQDITDFEAQETIHTAIGGNPQFLEFFVNLARRRSVGKLLEDITPVREKIGEWLLKEMVGELSEREKMVLKKCSVFQRPFGWEGLEVVGASDAVVERLVHDSLVKMRRDDGVYFMHQAVRDYVYALLDDDERKRAHAEAATCYKMLLEKKKAGVEDIFELHYHLIGSEQYEEAGNLVLDLFEPFFTVGFRGELVGLLLQTIETTEDRTKAGGFFGLGRVLEAVGEYEKAENCYKQSLDLKESLGDKQGIARSLHQLGNLQEKQGNYKEAENYYKQSLDLKESLGDKQGIAGSLGQLGMLQEDQGNYKEAENYYKQSLDLAESLGDKQGIAQSLHQLGNLQYRQGNYKEAENYYKQSLDLKESLGDKQGIAVSLHQLGNLQYRQGNYKEAENYYKQSLDLKESLGDKQGIAISLHQLGMLQEDQGNYKEAENYYKQSLDLKESLGDKQGIARSLHQLGMLQEDQGNYKEAENYYKQSLDLKESLGDKQGIAISLHQLGNLQYRQGNYKEAENYYKQSLDLKESLGDKQGIAISLHQLGNLQYRQGNYKEAENYYKQSLDLKESLGDKQGIAISLHQLGMLQEDQGNYKEAENYYKQSLDLAESLGDKQGIAISLHQLGMLQEDQGNYKEAENYYKQSLDLKESLGYKQGIASSLHQLGMLQEDQGNYKEAENYYKQSLDLAESLGYKQGIASSLHQLGMLQEKQNEYEKAVEHYITALAIFLELGSPDAETAIESLKRVRKTIGEQFDSYWKTMTNEEVPDFLKSTYEEMIEALVHYVMYVVDNNDQEGIKKATETLTKLIEESESDEKQFLQLLLDIVNRKDTTEKLKELKEPYKSILETCRN